MALLAQLQLKAPIIQVAAGKFLNAHSQGQPLIAALHPRSLCYFKLTASDDESFRLEEVFEHRLQGPPAFNMCQGHFGQSSGEQVCVQSIGCALSVFEGENRVLTRQLADSIHPGPMEYSSFSESIIATSGGYLSSIRYNVLTASSSTGQGKKINHDWTLNLGDTALELRIIGVLPIQPSILVLCRRSLFCVTHGGAPRFIIRLQCIATTFIILYNSRHPQATGGNKESAAIQLCIGTATKTLLFYQDTRMKWTCQLPFVPTSLSLATFGESLRSMIAVLSDDCRAFIGYLGTEPSLFRMPATETRFIDFDERKKELRELEEFIWKSGKGKEGVDGVKGVSEGLRMEVEVVMDGKSRAYDAAEDIPSATVLIDVSGGAMRSPLEVIFNGEIFAHQNTFTTQQGSPISISVFCKSEAVLDARCQIIAFVNTTEVLMREIILPLSLICRQAPPQRTSIFKLSLDSTQQALDVGVLFPGDDPNDPN